MSEPIQKVVIAGGGTAGWMTAAALSQFLPREVKICLVESDAIGTVGVGEATIPPLSDYNALLGIKEHEFLQETSGSYKLGIEFVDWGRIGQSYFHPFSTYGLDMQGINFHQFWSRQRLAGEKYPLDEYSIGALAAKAGKFMRPNLSDPRSPLAQIRHAYHVDAVKYAAYLRKYSETRRVERIEGKIIDVELDADSGNITALQLEGDRRVEGELFVDCTGFRALLIEGALKSGYEDWTHWLPCDRAVAIPCKSTRAFVPFTRSVATRAGWQWRIPLQHRIGNGQVYCSEYMSDDEAVSSLMSILEGEPLAAPNILRFTTGHRRDFWKKNCVAIGLSSGFLEPLESTSIHLIQEGIAKLIALFPDQSFNALEQETYNGLMGSTFDYVRDFLILHYHATERDDSGFWDHVRTMDIPASLQRHIDQFRYKGRFFGAREDLFTITSWVAVMVGQNILPEGYDPVVDGVPEEQIEAMMEDIRNVYREATDRMPPHEAFINKFCKASA